MRERLVKPLLRKILPEKSAKFFFVFSPQRQRKIRGKRFFRFEMQKRSKPFLFIAYPKHFYVFPRVKSFFNGNSFFPRLASDRRGLPDRMEKNSRRAHKNESRKKRVAENYRSDAERHRNDAYRQKPVSAFLCVEIFKCPPREDSPSLGVFFLDIQI